MEHTSLILLFGAALVAGGGFCVYAWNGRTRHVFGPALFRGPAEGRRVALTFDDGPTAYTEQILDILRARNVPATFFVCGRNVDRYPHILSRIQAEGHAIGNHSYSHPHPYFHRRAFFASQIDRTQDAIARVTGQRPKIFRPPYGKRWFGLKSVLRERGLHCIKWSDGGFDWLEESDIVRDTLRGVGPGSIILLHDGKRDFPSEQADRSRTVSALPAIIDGAREAGLTFVPLAEFLTD
ncbi:MAG: polysaccharide deacetylase family protein [Terriglobia bacterium]|jgi:peptidoglycan/xylan/chitin deacetylase (PgdA/CDA1 family)